MAVGFSDRISRFSEVYEMIFSLFKNSLILCSSSFSPPGERRPRPGRDRVRPAPHHPRAERDLLQEAGPAVEEVPGPVQQPLHLPPARVGGNLSLHATGQEAKKEVGR